MCLCVYIYRYLQHIPQTVWQHWGVLTVGVKARCLIEVVSGAFCIFPVNFNTEWFLWNVDVHFDCTGSHKKDVPGGVRGHFAGKFPYKMALVKCPCACRLRRLAQSVLPGLGISLPPQHHPPQPHHLPPPPHQPHHLPRIISIIIIIINILIHYLSTPPTLFGVSCRDIIYIYR